MPKPKKKKKPKDPRDMTLPRRPHGTLNPSGRAYEGAVVDRCLVPPVRCAVW